MREVELWIEQLPRGGADGGAAKKTYSRRNCLKKKRAKRTARIVGRATDESQVVSRAKNRRKSEFCTRGKQHQTNGLRLFEIRTLTLLRVDTDRIFLDVTARSCASACLPSPSSSRGRASRPLVPARAARPHLSIGALCKIRPKKKRVVRNAAEEHDQIVQQTQRIAELSLPPQFLGSPPYSHR